jgi:hypothetical protein
MRRNGKIQQQTTGQWLHRCGHSSAVKDAQKNEYNDYGEEESPRPPPEWPIQPPVQPALGSLPSTTGWARLSLLLTKHAASGSLAQPHRLPRLPATPCGVENESHRHTGVLDHALDLSAARHTGAFLPQYTSAHDHVVLPASEVPAASPAVPLAMAAILPPSKARAEQPAACPAPPERTHEAVLSIHEQPGASMSSDTSGTLSRSHSLTSYKKPDRVAHVTHAL